MQYINIIKFNKLEAISEIPKIEQIFIRSYEKLMFLFQIIKKDD